MLIPLLVVVFCLNVNIPVRYLNVVVFFSGLYCWVKSGARGGGEAQKLNQSMLFDLPSIV